MSPRGFTLVELLMSLAMTAILLASVGLGMHAAFRSYKENDSVAAASQTARAILGRISDEVRTADAVQADGNVLSIVPPDNAEGLTLIEYEYAQGALTLRRTVNGQTSIYPLLGTTGQVQVADFALSSTTGEDSQGQACTKSVTASLSLRVGEQTFAVTASAAPRRNQSF